eukprot:s6088_g3.t2
MQIYDDAQHRSSPDFPGPACKDSALRECDWEDPQEAARGRRVHRAMPRPTILAKATAFGAGLQVRALERSGLQSKRQEDRVRDLSALVPRPRLHHLRGPFVRLLRCCGSAGENEAEEEGKGSVGRSSSTRSERRVEAGGGTGNCHILTEHDITVPMNPLGPNGFLIKAGEHLPLVADGLRCYHKFKGQIEAEERARAFSLQRYLAKDGALVKVAELLPGSNLIASAMLDLRGHHQEAQEALNLLKNWRQCGSPDGPLAKVAEMLPGVDVIAFGIHVQSGNFAQALRSISKTRWTTITGESIVLTMMAETLHDWTITDLEVVKLDIDPVASFMYGGLLDVVTLLIEVNSQGQQRSRARARRVRLNSPRLDGKPHRGLRSAIPAVPPSTAAAATWSRIDDLGGGLFLCGAAALENRAELERLGIRSILNCATEDLYDRSYSGSSAPLRQKLEGYKVQVFDAQDVEEQPMTDLWKSGHQPVKQHMHRLPHDEGQHEPGCCLPACLPSSELHPTQPGLLATVAGSGQEARSTSTTAFRSRRGWAGDGAPGRGAQQQKVCHGSWVALNAEEMASRAAPARNPLYWAKDRVVTICRDVVTTLLQDTLPEMVPDMIDSAVAAINSLLPYYRSSWWPYRVFLPKLITTWSLLKSSHRSVFGLWRLMATCPSYKVVLVGDSGTGKTSLLKRCVEHQFSTDVLPTAGLDFQWKKVLGGRDWIRLKLWDLSGESRFRSLMPAYLQDAAAAIVVYDVTCWRSWSAARDWVGLVHHELGKETLLAMVGNKADLEGRREVSFDEAQKETEALGAIFLETSAKTGCGEKEGRKQGGEGTEDNCHVQRQRGHTLPGVSHTAAESASTRSASCQAPATGRGRQARQAYEKAMLPAIGKPPPDLEKVLADRITHISLRHRTVVPVRAVPARDLPCRRPGTDKALGALCCCAGGLAHSGWPLLAACALGCASGFFQLSSWARRQFVPWINAHNEQAWLGATKEPKQLYKRSSSQGSCDRASARMPLAVVAELPGEDVEQLASILGDYFCKELPLTKLIGQSGMAWLNERLSRFLAASVDEQTSPAVLPVVLHAEVSEGLYKSLGETWWLPSFSFAVIFQCRLEAGMQVSAAQVVFTDETIDQVAVTKFFCGAVGGMAWMAPKAPTGFLLLAQQLRIWHEVWPRAATETKR